MSNKAATRTSSKNWHPADIKAALAKRGFSLARIARENGYVETSPSKVFHKPWPAMELIMSKIIGEPPQNVWPERYDKYGNPVSTVRLARARRGRNG